MKYKLAIMPLFINDVNSATDYIKNTLKNPSTAEKLIQDVEDVIFERLPLCESFAQFQSTRKRKHPYYKITVRNFSIFYVVINNTMEVRRFLYSRRNIDKLI